MERKEGKHINKQILSVFFDFSKVQTEKLQENEDKTSTWAMAVFLSHFLLSHHPQIKKMNRELIIQQFAANFTAFLAIFRFTSLCASTFLPPTCVGSEEN